MLAYLVTSLNLLWTYLVPEDHEQEGQGLVEYAMILVFVAVMLIVLVAVLGPGLANIYSNIIRRL